jgi:uncharacterized membrane protein
MTRIQHPFDTIIEAFTVSKIPPDLAACILWLILAICAIYIPFINNSFLRILFGVPLILFIPGYALIAALFPKAKDIDGIERVALSFGLSIAVVPLIGLALNYTPFGIRLDPIVICMGIFTLCMCLIALYRRSQIPDNERFFVPVHAIRKVIMMEFYPPDSSRLDRILSTILLIAIIAAVATTVYVIIVPKEGEKFTEFFILGAKEKAADYPTLLVSGENSSLFIGIGNHEYKTINYTLETYMMNVTFDEITNTSSIQKMDRLDSFMVPVQHNQTVTTPYSFVPPSSGYNRIGFLLFNETVPVDTVKDMDRINSSYRDLHLWVTVRSRQE